MTPDKFKERAEFSTATLKELLMAMQNCKKPTMAIVRGGCHGIGFTMLSGIDFIYCSPDAVFQTPFMASM
jgi:enoyl-CoA hydratase/carnithine racemase